MYMPDRVSDPDGATWCDYNALVQLYICEDGTVFSFTLPDQFTQYGGNPLDTIAVGTWTTPERGE